MKTVGIIAEYDPFHKGHAYHMEEARALAGADYVIVVMSPDFLQRGAPALIDKWVRARMALLSGADLVLEMPVRSAVGSAEYFASGGVRMLDSLGCVDALSCGLESADQYGMLMQAADFFSKEEPGEYRAHLRDRLREGMSFPKARAQAFLEYQGCQDKEAAGNLLAVLSRPNNILAIEYQKAILRQKSPMKLIPVQRLGTYHAAGTRRRPAEEGRQANEAKIRAEEAGCRMEDVEYRTEEAECRMEDTGCRTEEAAQQPGFASASSIREALFLHDMKLPEQWKGQLPASSLRLLEEELSCGRYVADRDLDLLLHRTLMEKREMLSDYVDLDEALANRIRGCLNRYTGFAQFALLVQSKQYTLSRIRRALLHVLLGIRKEESPPGCARVLGFRKEAQPLLRQISQNGSIPLSTQCGFSGILKEDVEAAHLWEMILTARTGRPFRHERQRPLIVL